MGGQALLPEEAVEVPVAHVLKDHEQRTALGADPKEAHDMLMLQHGEQLGLSLEVLPGALRHLLQSLDAGARRDWVRSPLPCPHPRGPHPAAHPPA